MTALPFRSTGEGEPISLADLPPLHTAESDFINIRGNLGLYVDKTLYFRELLALHPRSHFRIPDLQVKHQFLARPRRFGKSLLISTLEAWFQGVPPDHDSASALEPGTWPEAPEGWSRPEWLWGGLDGADWHGVHGWHPVIRLDMSEVEDRDPDILESKLTVHIRDRFRDWCLRGANPAGNDLWTPPASASPSSVWLGYLIEWLGFRYGSRPVVLIDEYDAPLAKVMGISDPEDRAQSLDLSPFLSALGSFYKILKSKQSRLHWVFITGVAPFAQVNVFSGLNNLEDITWKDAYATLCGFTENEARTDLAPHVRYVAQNNPYPETQIWQDLRSNYNGYQFSPQSADEGKHVYNPYTLIKCLQGLLEGNMSLRDGKAPTYWAQSGTPSMLARMAAQGWIKWSMDPPPPTEFWDTSYNPQKVSFAALMLYAGYYTIRGSESENSLLYVYPNHEVCSTFTRFLWELYTDATSLPPSSTLKPMYEALRDRRYGEFRDDLLRFVAGIPGAKLRLEDDFHVILHVLFRALDMEFSGETSVWGGRSDLVLHLPAHTCVAEVKYNGTTREALAQIHEKGYFQPYLRPDRPVEALALNFRRGPETEERPPGIELDTRTYRIAQT